MPIHFLAEDGGKILVVGRGRCRPWNGDRSRPECRDYLGEGRSCACCARHSFDPGDDA